MTLIIIFVFEPGLQMGVAPYRGHDRSPNHGTHGLERPVHHLVQSEERRGAEPEVPNDAVQLLKSPSKEKTIYQERGSRTKRTCHGLVRDFDEVKNGIEHQTK